MLVTRRWPASAEEALANLFDPTFNLADAPLTGGELAEALSVFDAVLPTVTDRIGADVLAGPEIQTRILANYGAGVTHIDLEAARSQGVTVTNTPDVLTDATADLAMTLLLMAARRAGEGERQVRSGGWSGWRPTHMMGTQVTGQSLGIIGMGRIGRAVAHRAVNGFGMEVVYFNRSPTDAGVPARALPTVEEVLRTADFVSLHVPGGAGNRHLIDESRLAMMKPQSILINTSRGEVIDERALAEALATGTITGAGLDVYEKEPCVHPALLDLENVVLLPHLGSATNETRVAMGLRVVDNLVDFFAGRQPRDLVP